LQEPYGHGDPGSAGVIENIYEVKVEREEEKGDGGGSQQFSPEKGVGKKRSKSKKRQNKKGMLQLGPEGVNIIRNVAFILLLHLRCFIILRSVEALQIYVVCLDFEQRFCSFLFYSHTGHATVSARGCEHYREAFHSFFVASLLFYINLRSVEALQIYVLCLDFAQRFC
jgi:hypothetical protein